MTGVPGAPVSSLAQRIQQLRARVRSSLEIRVAVSFLAVSLVVAIGTETVAYLQAARTVRQTVYDRLSSVGTRRESDVHEWVKSQQNFVGFIAGLPSVVADAERVIAARRTLGSRTRSPVDRDLHALLDTAIARGLAASRIEVLAAEGGLVVASTDSATIGEYRVTDPYFVEGLRSSYIQKMYPSPVTGRPMLTVAAPLRRPDGRSIGVVAAHLDLQVLEDMLPQGGTGYPVEFYLVNRFGEFVSAARFGRAEFRRGIQSFGISQALADRRGIGEYRNYEGRPVMGAYAWLPDIDVALMVELPEREAFAAIRRMLFLQSGIFLSGLLMLAYATRTVSRRVIRPILTTAEAAKRLAAGDFDVQAPVITDDEVGMLAVSFNEMTARLRMLYRDLQGQVDATRVALDALRQNEALVTGIIDTSATIVLVMDLDRRCVLVNRRFEELFGMSRESSEGRPILEVLPAGPAALVGEASQAVIDAQKVIDREWTMETTEGTRSFLAACFPVRDPRGLTTAVGVIATDVTDRKRAEDERREFEANVQHAQKLESLGVMAGGIAHDFNNILSAISSNTAVALSALDDPQEVKESLEHIQTASRRAADLTRQMLTYAGRGVSKHEAIDLNDRVRELEKLARMSMSKKIQFDLHLAEGPLWLSGDSAQLTQVVLNLFINAGDAIADSNGLIAVTTTRIPALSPKLAEAWMGDPPGPGPFVVLSVQDNGRGMDEATRQRIFEPFFTTKSTGRGLGLSAVLGIVKGLGGALTVQSELRRGTLFTIAFRAADPPR